MNIIPEFQLKYRFLSNFWYVPIHYEGLTYPTLEHAFVAAKTLLQEFRLAVRDSGGPGDAKRMGRQLTLRPDWEDVKIGIMRDLLRLKFANDPLRSLLLETGDAELIEGNDHQDDFWGVCNGTGQNWLGKLLMEVRKELSQ